MKALIPLFLLLLLSLSPASALELRASANGVVADGVTNQAAALQKLIDRAAAAGGGRVVVDGGVVVSGMITLKSGVTLEIAEGATLMNTGVKEDYPFVPVDFVTYYPRRRSMIFASKAENITVVGKGTIDGNSSAYKARSSESDRVSLIRFDECRNIEVHDITLQNASMWTQHFYRSDDILVTGLTIRNYMKNDDGLNVDGCHNVVIRDCDITSHDDAITLKNTSHRESRNVLVEDCRLESVKSAFKFGTESYAGFVDVQARNLEITGGRDALAFFSSDGARIENILVENVTITDTACPIMVLLGNRLRPIEGDPKVLETGSVKNVVFRNIRATGAKWALMLVGTEEKGISNILLEDIEVGFAREPGGKKNSPRADRVVPENTHLYPQSRMFNTLNAWGLFVRHARDVILRDVTFTPTGKSGAHMASFENVENLVLENMRVDVIPTEPAWIKAEALRSARLDLTWPDQGLWIEFSDDSSGNIALSGEMARPPDASRFLNPPTSLRLP